jgi:hypothetical protein
MLSPRLGLHLDLVMAMVAVVMVMLLHLYQHQTQLLRQVLFKTPLKSSSEM